MFFIFHFGKQLFSKTWKPLSIFSYQNIGSSIFFRKIQSNRVIVQEIKYEKKDQVKTKVKEKIKKLN